MRSNNPARSRSASLVAVLATLLATILIGPSAATAAVPEAKAVSQCGGRLPFGKIVTCPAIVDAAEDVYRFTTTADNDVLFTMLTRSSGEWVNGLVADKDGNVVCGVFVDSQTCQVGPAGDYKLILSLAYGTGTGNYSIAIQSTRTPTGCKALGSSFFSFASSGVNASLPTGSAGKCFTFDQPQGSVLYGARFLGTGSFYMTGFIYDAQGHSLCGLQYGANCQLTSAGPYTMIAAEFYGGAADFTLKMPRLSASAGCAVVKPGVFGDGLVFASGSIPTNYLACNKVKASSAGPVSIQVTPTQRGLSWILYDDAGTQICESYTNSNSCTLPTAGNYTSLLYGANFDGTPVAYTIGVTALYADNGCAALTGTSWDQATLQVHQKSGVQVNCQPIKGNAGDRIITYRAPTVYNYVYAELLDSTGTVVCPGFSDQDGCVLPADGRYRVVSRLMNWDDPTATDAVYNLQVRRLSSPQGCPAITVGAYNAAPAGALGGIRCRILDIPAAGGYLLKAVSDENYETYAQVYDANGIKVCGSQWCDIPAAGKYTAVLDGSSVNTVIGNDVLHAFALLPRTPSGCPSVGADPAHLTTYRSSFSSVGQFDCVTIDSPADSRVVMLRPGDATGVGRPDGLVFDHDGNSVCESSYSLRQETCQLTGNGPFVFSYAAPEATTTGAYAMQFARVSGDSGCSVLAQSADGVNVTSSATAFSACFTVPADQHAARETFTFRRTAGTGDAELAIYDGSGLRYCGSLLSPSADRTITCSLPAGPYTVLLETDAVDATYQVKHQAAA